MTDELFGERRRALEEGFFRKYNAELLEAMRAKAQREHLQEALRDSTGIADERLLQHLVDAGMTPASLTAAAMVPLVAVAWADGKLEPGERAQVMRDSAVRDLGEPARALLEGWLEAEPQPELFETWAEYMRYLTPRLDLAARSSLKSATVARARAVAEAAGGGPYGIGRRTAREEQTILQEIEAAFDA